MGEGVFLGYSLIIIKWTWGFFPKKFAVWPPLQLGSKKYAVTNIDLEILIHIQIFILFSQEVKQSALNVNLSSKRNNVFKTYYTQNIIYERLHWHDLPSSPVLMCSHFVGPPLVPSSHSPAKCERINNNQVVVNLNI